LGQLGTGDMSKLVSEGYFYLFILGRWYEEYIRKYYLLEKGLNLLPSVGEQHQFTIGDTREGMEIKNDTQFNKTGNLYFEIDERSGAGILKFVPSGIYSGSLSYLIGDFSNFGDFIRGI